MYVCTYTVHVRVASPPCSYGGLAVRDSLNAVAATRGKIFPYCRTVLDSTEKVFPHRPARAPQQRSGLRMHVPRLKFEN
eukprot:COSAG02_NODE_579_length_20073_cov_2118.572745_1_plen_79_part_00